MRVAQCRARRFLPATLMADRKYLPFSEEYENLYEELKSDESLWGLFAAIKYCFALNKGTECVQLKEDLLEKTRGTDNVASAKYFYYSLQAFEARMAGDNKQALFWIDSAFLTPPVRYFHNASCDKIIILAEIYGEKREYEKSIARLENIPHQTGFEFVKGYATYRLSYFYEKVEDMDKAIAKYNLFIKDYSDCDEKYRPWLEEVTERREGVMAKLL